MKQHKLMGKVRLAGTAMILTLLPLLVISCINVGVQQVCALWPRATLLVAPTCSTSNDEANGRSDGDAKPDGRYRISPYSSTMPSLCLKSELFVFGAPFSSMHLSPRKGTTARRLSFHNLASRAANGRRSSKLRSERLRAVVSLRGGRCIEEKGFPMATASDFNNMQGGGIASTDSYAKLLKIFHELCADLRLSKEEIASVVSISIAGCPISDEVSSRALWQLASETAAAMTTEHPDFGVLAARILVRQLQQEIPQTFSDAIIALHEQGAISSQLYSFVLQHRNSIDSAICYSRDYAFDYFGFKTLEKSYLLRSPGGTILESPQYLFMRVALALHLDNITAALESYESMSQHQFIHASPTLFNAGTRNGQLSSCFLLHSPCDSIEGIFKTISDCALISKGAGGIGLSASGIRSRGSYIRGTKGFSSGLVPMLRVFDATAKYVDQGGGKRPGAFAVYLEPWHADIFDFLLLRKNSGKEEARARDLFYGLWIPDLFMHRVASDGNWSLMCPHECPGLDDCWGAEFERKYEVYEREGRAKKQVRARDLWNAIIDAQLETGTPYMLYKDSCNQKSNQKNLGTIKCSNLCTEIIEFTAPNETAVCNLASIVLPKCVEVDQNGTVSFNFGKLMSVTRIVTRNLNNIIDLTIYPVPEAKTSNRRHRPIGIGVQGLADVFQVMGFPFESVEARTLNKAIFESIYFAALDASCDLAKQSGPYESYQGSPASLGILQHDLWRQDGAFSRNSTTTILDHGTVLDWPALRNRIARYGLRNSLLVAPMPTASTAQILGNNECFEPYTSNIYVRRVRAGEFVIINKHLVRSLMAEGLWTKKVRDEIIRSGGSVQNIASISPRTRSLFKTAWEIKQRSLIDMAADRGEFIDQSQSLNLFLAHPDRDMLTSMHFHAWRRGLKTGMYYLRTKPAARAIQFTLDPAARQDNLDSTENNAMSEPVACLSCQG